KDHQPATEDGDKIDRFQLGNQILETNAVCTFDVPVVIGSLSDCFRKTMRTANWSSSFCLLGREHPCEAADGENGVSDPRSHESLR
ncbi:MAG: hypothetical protein ABGZ24_26265, partial [Fuerstiella sp.]